MTKAVKRLPRFRLNSRKSVIVASVVALIVIGIVAGVFTVRQAADQQQASIENPSTVSGRDTLTFDGEVPEITGSLVSPTPTPSTEPQPSLDESIKAPSNNVTYTPKCRGAGCVTPGAKYSIVTPGAITVTAGTNSPVYTASTSSGVAVDWSTPQYNGPGFGPFGYTNGAMRGTPSLQYYIRAESHVPAGNYTLQLSAVQGSSETLVRAAITVTVVAPAPSTPPQM